MGDSLNFSALLTAMEKLLDAKSLSSNSCEPLLGVVVSGNKGNYVYDIQVGGSQFEAQSISNENFKSGDSVYVLIGNKAQSNTVKYILGKSTVSSKDILNDIEKYLAIKHWNRVSKNSFLKLISEDRASFITPLRSDINDGLCPNYFNFTNQNVLAQYIRKYGSFVLNLDILSQIKLTYSNIDFGFICEYRSEGKLKSIQTSLASLGMEIWNTENKFINKEICITIPEEDQKGFTEFVSIQFFAKGFLTNDENSYIELKNVNLYAVELIDFENIKVNLQVSPDESAKFLKEGEKNSLMLFAEVSCDGQKISSSDLSYLWFLKDSSVDITSPVYDWRGGIGWSCLNEVKTYINEQEERISFASPIISQNFNITLANAPTYENEYKCLAIYQNKVIATSNILKVKNLSYDNFFMNIYAEKIVGQDQRMHLSNIDEVIKFFVNIDTAAQSDSYSISYSWKVNGKEMFYIPAQDGYNETKTYFYQKENGLFEKVENKDIKKYYLYLDLNDNKDTFLLGYANCHNFEDLELIISCLVEIKQNGKVVYRQEDSIPVTKTFVADGETYVLQEQEIYYDGDSYGCPDKMTNEDDILSVATKNAWSYQRPFSGSEGYLFSMKRKIVWNTVNGIPTIWGYYKKCDVNSYIGADKEVYMAIYDENGSFKKFEYIGFIGGDGYVKEDNTYIYTKDMSVDKNPGEWGNPECISIHGDSGPAIEELNTFNKLSQNGAIDGIYWDEAGTDLYKKADKWNPKEKYFTLNPSTREYILVQNPVQRELSNYYINSGQKQRLFINASFLRAGTLTVGDENKELFRASIHNKNVSIGGFDVSDSAIFTRGKASLESPYKQGIFLGNHGFRWDPFTADGLIDFTANTNATYFSPAYNQTVGKDMLKTSSVGSPFNANLFDLDDFFMVNDQGEETPIDIILSFNSNFFGAKNYRYKLEPDLPTRIANFDFKSYRDSYNFPSQSKPYFIKSNLMAQIYGRDGIVIRKSLIQSSYTSYYQLNPKIKKIKVTFSSSDNAITAVQFFNSSRNEIDLDEIFYPIYLNEKEYNDFKDKEFFLETKDTVISVDLVSNVLGKETTFSRENIPKYYFRIKNDQNLPQDRFFPIYTWNTMRSLYWDVLIEDSSKNDPIVNKTSPANIFFIYGDCSARTWILSKDQEHYNNFKLTTANPYVLMGIDDAQVKPKLFAYAPDGTNYAESLPFVDISDSYVKQSQSESALDLNTFIYKNIYPKGTKYQLFFETQGLSNWTEKWHTNEFNLNSEIPLYISDLVLYGKKDDSYFQLSPNGLEINTDNFKIDKKGNVFINGSGHFTGDIYANNGYFRGEVHATSGEFTGHIHATSLTIDGGLGGTNLLEQSEGPFVGVYNKICTISENTPYTFSFNLIDDCSEQKGKNKELTEITVCIYGHTQQIFVGTPDRYSFTFEFGSNRTVDLDKITFKKGETYLNVSHLQLEKGSIATDWSPNSADVGDNMFKTYFDVNPEARTITLQASKCLSINTINPHENGEHGKLKITTPQLVIDSDNNQMFKIGNDEKVFTVKPQFNNNYNFDQNYAVYCSKIFVGDISGNNGSYIATHTSIRNLQNKSSSGSETDYVYLLKENSNLSSSGGTYYQKIQEKDIPNLTTSDKIFYEVNGIKISADVEKIISLGRFPNNRNYFKQKSFTNIKKVSFMLASTGNKSKDKYNRGLYKIPPVKISINYYLADEEETLDDLEEKEKLSLEYISKETFSEIIYDSSDALGDSEGMNFLVFPEKLEDKYVWIKSIKLTYIFPDENRENILHSVVVYSDEAVRVVNLDRDIFSDRIFSHWVAGFLFMVTSETSPAIYMDNILPASNYAYIGAQYRPFGGIYASVFYGELKSGSDKNIKNSIFTISTKYEEFFDKLKPVSFKYNKDLYNKTHIGFIAQDVVDAAESVWMKEANLAAYATDNSIFYLCYPEFIALNTHEIQKLKTRVKELEEKIKTLTSNSVT